LTDIYHSGTRNEWNKGRKWALYLCTRGCQNEMHCYYNKGNRD